MNNSSNNPHRLALDNNALCAILGMIEKIKNFSRVYKISFEEVINQDGIIDNLYFKHPKAYRDKMNKLFDQFKLAINKRVRFVIIPTVLNEISNNNISFSKNKPNMFFHDFCVEHVAFDKKQQQLINQLTKKLLSPQQTANECGEKPPIEGNRNQDYKNFDHDARIVAECVFAGADLFTFDSDFKNRNMIYQTIQDFMTNLSSALKFEKQYRDFSKFKIIPSPKHQIKQRMAFEK